MQSRLTQSKCNNCPSHPQSCILKVNSFKFVFAFVLLLVATYLHDSRFYDCLCFDLPALEIICVIL